jgi:hypothetical protein
MATVLIRNDFVDKLFRFDAEVMVMPVTAGENWRMMPSAPSLP